MARIFYRSESEGRDISKKLGAKTGPQRKAGRGWHHHSRAPHRRSMGQGGI